MLVFFFLLIYNFIVLTLPYNMRKARWHFLGIFLSFFPFQNHALTIVKLVGFQMVF